MRNRIYLSIAIAAAAFAGAPDAEAGVIDIISQPGTACEFGAPSGMTGDCTTVAIEPHAAWQPNDPNPPGYGGEWVSYADTGIDGQTVAPRDLESPVFTIVESFVVDTAASLDFWIWADDTASLYFNLSGAPFLELVTSANLSQDTCADGSIGCETPEYYNLTRNLAPGAYDITMGVYQTGTGTTNASNPFGVLYSGRVTTTTVPAPGTLALFGLGLLAIATTRRRVSRLVSNG